MSNNFFPRAELKFRAKTVLKGNWRATLMVVLIYLVCASILTAITNRIDNSPETISVTTALIQCVILLVGGVLVHGILEFSFCRYFLNLGYNGTAEFGDFVEGFSDAGRAAVAYVWQMIFIVLWCLLMVPSVIVAIIGQESNSVALAFVAVILFIVSFVVVVWRVVRYTFQYMVMSDCPTVDGRDALKHSIAITEGHVWDLIKLDISFFFWGLLTVITAGLASFYVVPYMYESNVQAYQWMRDEAFRTGRLNPADLGYQRNANFSN